MKNASHIANPVRVLAKQIISLSSPAEDGSLIACCEGQSAEVLAEDWTVV